MGWDGMGGICCGLLDGWLGGRYGVWGMGYGV